MKKELPPELLLLASGARELLRLVGADEGLGALSAQMPAAERRFSSSASEVSSQLQNLGERKVSASAVSKSVSQ